MIETALNSVLYNMCKGNRVVEWARSWVGEMKRDVCVWKIIDYNLIK